MGGWFGVLTALLIGDGAEPSLPSRLRLEESALTIPLQAVQGDGFRIGLTLAAQARVSLPFGQADRGDVFVSGNTIFIEDHLDYSELFDPGYGFALEADLMFRPLPSPDPWVRSTALGGFVAFGWDWYGGSETRDETGTRVRPDTLKIPTIFAGIKGAGVVEGNFFGDLRFGLGAVRYPSLKARFEPGGRGELFSESWEFAMELRMHFGWKLGPMGFVFGMGGRLMSPPDPGRNSTLDPGAFFTIDFELGAEIGF